MATASSTISIPGITASASSTGRGTLAGAFQITGTTGPVSVHISAGLSGNQDLSTSADSVSADSEIIFNFILAGQSSPLLSVDSVYSIGPNQSLSVPYSQTVGADVVLDSGVTYSFVTEVDSESNGFDTPEPWAAPALFAGLCVMVARRRRSRR